VTADEGTIEVPGGRVWYRSVVPYMPDRRPPLLCLHGGPGPAGRGRLSGRCTRGGVQP